MKFSGSFQNAKLIPWTYIHQKGRGIELSPQRFDRIGLGAFAVFCLVIIVSSLRLGLGRLDQPEPGLIPFLAASCLFVITIMQYFRKAKGKGEADPAIPREWRKLVGVTGSLFLYSFLLEPLGFFLSTAIWLFFLFWLADPKRWVRSAIQALVTVVVTYVLFVLLFNLQLPRGPWGV